MAGHSKCRHLCVPDIVTRMTDNTWERRPLRHPFACCVHVDVSLQVMMHTIENGSSPAAAYATEFLDIARDALEDPFPEVVVKACNCLKFLATLLKRRMQAAAKELVAATLPLTTHNRSAVRCAAVQAVQYIVPCGAHEMILDMVAWRDPNCIAIKAFYEPDPKVRAFHRLYSRCTVPRTMNFSPC
jgi:hypothetical protein